MIFKSKKEPLTKIEPLKKPRSAKKESLFNRKKVRSKFDGRRTLIILFLLTAAASLFFYLKTEWPLLWQKITSPVILSSLPKGTVFDPSPILNEVKELTKDLRGVYGLYVYRLDSRESYGIKKTEVFPAASLIKLPVMLAVYQEGERGNLKLDDYREKVEVMGQRSDNAAFNQMVKLLGQEKIQEIINNLGMTKTSLAENETTPMEIGLFFQKLYEEELVTNDHRVEIFSFLTDSIYEDRIPAGLPENVLVVHKIGTELGSFSDAGIVFSEKPFILVIISKDARETEASEVLPKIAAAIWEFENNDKN